MLFEIELDEDGVSNPETLEEELRRRFWSLALIAFRGLTTVALLVALLSFDMTWIVGDAVDRLSVILDAVVVIYMEVNRIFERNKLGLIIQFLESTSGSVSN